MNELKPIYSYADDRIELLVPAGAVIGEAVLSGERNVHITVSDDAQVRILRRPESGGGRCKIDVGDRAKVVFEEICFCSGEQHDEITLGADSRLKIVTCCLSDGDIKLNSNVDLAGARSEVEIWGLYVAGGHEHVDMNMDVRHLMPDCKSSELVKGIASGEAVGRFHGLIYVAPHAQRTDAVQQSRNLLLSLKARIMTEPQLEIYADDVKCGHGATVGQMDNEAIYYMRQRGIDEREARRLQMKGFVNDIVSRFEGAGLYDEIHALVEQKIETV